MTKLTATAASNGKAAVLMGVFSNGEIYLSRYAPKSVGKPESRAELNALIDKALSKMGVKRDRRYKLGYRKI